MARHIQSLTASRLCLLPRILPAPQAFLGFPRVARMYKNPGFIVCGVYSGTVVHELNYFANAILPIASLKKYEVAIWKVSLTGKENL